MKTSGSGLNLFFFSSFVPPSPPSSYASIRACHREIEAFGLFPWVWFSSFSSFKLCEYKCLPESDVKPPCLCPAHPRQGVVVLCALLLQAEQQRGENRHGWDVPEHEGDGGEKGDDSAKGDVAPRSRRQSWTVQQDVQPIQEVRHLRGVEVDEDGKRVRVEEQGNRMPKMREHIIKSSMG